MSQRVEIASNIQPNYHFEQYKEYLVKDTVIIAEGRVDIKEGKLVVLIQRLQKI